LVNAIVWLSSLVPEGRGDERLWGRGWFLLSLVRMPLLPLPTVQFYFFALRLNLLKRLEGANVPSTQQDTSRDRRTTEKRILADF